MRIPPINPVCGAGGGKGPHEFGADHERRSGSCSACRFGLWKVSLVSQKQPERSGRVFQTGSADPQHALERRIQREADLMERQAEASFHPISGKSCSRNRDTHEPNSPAMPRPKTAYFDCNLFIYNHL